MNTNPIVDNKIFSGERVFNVAVLKIKDNPLYQMTDLDAKETLFEFLDAINDSDDIRVLLFRNLSARIS